MKRVDAWALGQTFTSEWSSKGSRCVIWERDDRWDFRDAGFYWKRFTIRIHPEQPLSDVQTMTARLGAALAQPRLETMLLSLPPPPPAATAR